jgi:hypothetical protein
VRPEGLGKFAWKRRISVFYFPMFLGSLTRLFLSGVSIEILYAYLVTPSVVREITTKR